MRTWHMAALAGLLVGTAVSAAELYVASGGKDTNPGTQKQPFATLEQARNEIRKLKAAGTLPKGGVTVQVRGGIYELSRPLELTAEDSGTAEAPITYRAYGREQVRLVGGRVVTGWKPVTDAGVLARLDPSARGKVQQADLKALGLTTYGKMESGKSWANSTPGLEVFFRDEPMTLARWPNEGYTHIADVAVKDGHSIHGASGSKVPRILYEGDRPARWVGEKDVMVHGYWFWDWADQRYRVESIDTEKREIVLPSNPPHAFGFRKGQWYYAYNILCELDKPGEWYLDRDQGILYFWPPEPLDRHKTLVSVLPHLATMKDVSHLTLRGLTLEGTQATAVTINGGTHTRLVACTLRNIGQWGVSINGGSANGVLGCDLYHLGDGGVSLTGGDRKTLTPAGHYVENCHIHHYGRWNPIIKPGVGVYGVGNRVSRNLIHHAPHKGILFGGNDHVFELNEIHSVVQNANDAGVIYGGRDATARGHIIRHNYIHHIYGREGRGCMGIYLDDMFCSATITGNIFYKVPRAAFIGGGRDNVVENNLFVECKPAIHVDARALGWAARGMEGMIKNVTATPYQQEPWRSRYPQLLTYLEDDPAVPKGNIIARNISLGGKWDYIEGKARPHVKFENNLLDQDPLLMDMAKEDFRLRPDSPAWKLGFQRIPVEKIGLYRSEDRATWPVRHAVDPEPVRPETAKPAVQAGPAPVCKAARLGTAPTIDGTLAPGEWAAAASLVLEQGLEGEKSAPGSRAWVARDGAHLLIAVENTVVAQPAVRVGSTWGQDDAVELAFRDPTRKDAPILVLRGFAGGAFASSDEAGAPAAAVKKAAEGVQYAAKVVGPTQWTAEWRIPLASLGVDPAKQTRLAFSLSVRKTGSGQWLQWRGTRAATWEAGNAGFLELAP